METRDQPAGVTVSDAVAAVNEHLARTRVDWVPVTPLTRLDDLDLDSFEIANVLLGLEEARGCQLSVDSLVDATFVKDLVESGGPL